jgi:hypothetical protein
VTEYSTSSLQQPVAPSRLDEQIFTFGSNTTLTIETAEFLDSPQAQQINSRTKRANKKAYDDYGSGDDRGDEGEIAPSSWPQREDEEEGGGENDFAEKTTIEDGLILGGPRDKREEDCKNDQQIEKISDNLERVKADVEKISAHIFGDQLQIKSLQKQADGTARLPICFFQPDSASLSGQTDGNYFTGQLTGGDTNPVTCVFVTPPSAPVAEKFEGKIKLPVPQSARQNGGGNFTDGNGNLNSL